MTTRHRTLPDTQPPTRRTALARPGAKAIAASAALAGLTASATVAHATDAYFNRVATFPVFENTDITEETVSEIVTATEDGMTLLYTDSSLNKIGFVDITTPSSPVADGTVDVDGEPTSVGVAGGFALAAVVREDSTFVDPKGDLQIIDIASKTIVRTIDLGGQPDAVAVSPDRAYAAIAIENERDEDFEPTDGEPPQLPGGKVVVVEIADITNPDTWTTKDVDVSGLDGMLFPEDPEPEFVDINALNLAVVTLQENNHIVVIDLTTCEIVNHFPCGEVDLKRVDATEDDVIKQFEKLDGVPREPDAVAWISDTEFATADEGDLFGGSRGFTVFDVLGNVVFTSGNSDDHLVARIGHYPEDRSENKGNEPEGAEFGTYGDDGYLFIGSERSSVISVYHLDGGDPEFVQVLPAALGPEGLFAIPSRNLFVVSSEEDSRDDGFRSGITIYGLSDSDPTYPTIVSRNRHRRTPIAWGALSALAADPKRPDRAWTVHDSYYKENKIFTLNTKNDPAVIVREGVIKDRFGLLQEALDDFNTPGTPWEEWEEFAEYDPSALINGDGTVNLDPEGVALHYNGCLWIALEGSGTFGEFQDVENEEGEVIGQEPARPIASFNLLLLTLKNGAIMKVVTLPENTNARQRRFGLEGVTTVGKGRHGYVYVCFQREWAVNDDDPRGDLGADPAGHVRIGRYHMKSDTWTFYYYPLDEAESENGGWVGLSEIVAVDKETFYVVERDNQANVDAAIKRIYKFSTAGLTPLPEPPLGETPAFPVVEKELVRDLIPDLEAPNGFVIEKVEGLMVNADGDAYIVTDNDGVDDNSGETQLINLGPLE